MESHYTDPELKDLVVFYLHGRGRQKLAQLTRGYPRQYQALAQAQDRIGWRHFTEGKLAKDFDDLARFTTLAFYSQIMRAMAAQLSGAMPAPGDRMSYYTFDDLDRCCHSAMDE